MGIPDTMDMTDQEFKCDACRAQGGLGPNVFPLPRRNRVAEAAGPQTTAAAKALVDSTRLPSSPSSSVSFSPRSSGVLKKRKQGPSESTQLPRVEAAASVMSRERGSFAPHPKTVQLMDAGVAPLQKIATPCIDVGRMPPAVVPPPQKSLVAITKPGNDVESAREKVCMARFTRSLVGIWSR